MHAPHRSPRSTSAIKSFLAALAFAACAQTESGPNDSGTGGTSTGGAGTSGAGAAPGMGGTTGAAGTSGAAGTVGTTGVAGTTGTAGTTGSAGATGAAGTIAAAGRGGTTGTGGTGSSGTTGAAGTSAAAGRAGTTGAAGRGGTTGTAGTSAAAGRGGTTGSGGTTGAGGASDPCSVTNTLTGGTVRSSSNASGTAAGLAWTIWSNGSGGSITTYSIPAFSAAWNNSGDFLARIGLQWNASKTFDQYGTISAQFNSKKTGNAGGYSYIGIYGWSVSPCVEFYIVDDSYNRMPVNPGNTTNKGTVTIDGSPYILYLRNTTGTGGSKCPGVSSWAQYYSVRMTARTCGQISITEHFKAWAAAGMPLGKMDQAQILIEAGGGVGTIDFTTANVTATTP